jgi:hypothetical protein
MMQRLLEKEGVEVKDDKVLHFDQHFWHPKALEMQGHLILDSSEKATCRGLCE